MSNFYGSELIFDGVSSLNFDLRITNFESGGTSNGSAGSEAKLVEKRIYRRTTPYYYGRLLHDPLEFEITLANFDSKFSSLDRNTVESWLLGRSGYKELMIVQNDMSSMVFNAYIDKATIKYVGNIAVGIVLNIKCREPWGFEHEKTLLKTYSDVIVTETFNFYNASAEDDYLYPLVKIKATANPLVGGFGLTNVTDDNRAMGIGSLRPNEEITIDCNRQIIYSDSGLNIMSIFNKQFFRLLPKINVITIFGSITYLSMTYQFAKKIGG